MFPFKKPTVTETTAVFKEAVKTLEQEYIDNKETLIDTFRSKLRSMLNLKAGKISKLKKKVETVTESIADEEKDVKAINAELDNLSTYNRNE